MAWLEAHDELVNHPKTAALGELMGWNKWEAAGRLLSFWHWCLKYAPTGDLRRFNDAQMAVPVELNGHDAQRFVKALVASRWIDRDEDIFRVHDWPDYTKRFLKESRFKDRPDKWLEVLAVYPETSGVTPESLRQPTRPTNHSPPPPKGGGAAGGKSRRESKKAAILAGMRGGGNS